MLSQLGERKRIRIGPVTLDAVSFEELLVLLDQMAESPQTDFVVFCEAHLCVRAAREPEVCSLLDQASLVLADGVAMTAGARLIGERFQLIRTKKTENSLRVNL